MGFIMTAEGHLLFSIASAVFAKNAELTPVLAHGDWWHIIPSAILTCLLPDIDHPKSFLGQRLKWVSKPIARAFGHRGFTHSLLAVFALLATFYLKVPDTWYSGAAQRQSTGAIFMHGVVCLGGVDATVHAGKQRHTLVFANDYYPANAVQSFYKSPD